MTNCARALGILMLVAVPAMHSAAGTVTLNGGQLLGEGSVQGNVVVGSGATIAPGPGPGCLAVGDLDFSASGSAFSVQLGGGSACSGHDQLQVSGSVTLGASLALSLYNAYTTTGGTSYRILSNDNADANVGAFSGLPEGSTFSLGGKNLSISYVGGDGNDVVLFALADQLINFAPLADKTFGDAGFNLSATASSGLSVSLTTTTPTNCHLSGITLTPLAAGTCSVMASQSGSTRFNAAPSVGRSFVIHKATQSITFTAIADKTIAEPDFDLAATASSELVVSFSSDTPTTCSVSGARVSMQALGRCTITASQPGSVNYLAASTVTQEFTVHDVNFDYDGDGIHNDDDPDDDNDNVPDAEDAFPFDETEWFDSDGDGIGDNSDPTPYSETGGLNIILIKAALDARAARQSE